MIDPIDEYVIQQLKEYDEKKLRNCTKEGLDLADDEVEKKKKEEQKVAFEGTCKFVKEVLGDNIEKCTLSSRLASSPCALVTSEFGWSANMERIMKAQALRDASMSSYMVSKKTMELNPDHPIIVELNKKIADNKGDKNTKDLIWLLFETSLLTSGFSLEDPTTFGSRIHQMINFALNIKDEDGMDDEAPALDEEGETADTKMEEID